MKKCQQCGQEMASDAPEGLCARCLLSAVSREDASAPGPAIIDIADADAVAERLPQFEILSFLGRGGMGVVYRARQRQLDRTVALKILPPADALTPDFVERFRREARSLARLNHPNIVHVHDFGESGGLYFLVMEFVDGVNLRETLQARKLSPPEALAIVPKICDALHYAHEEGVVHRDIKPENILLDQRGRVKIADFGLARMLGREQPEDRLTHSGMTVGTPRYMAPEQFDHPESVDHRADIYSLGVVFYEMLTGELPMGRFAPPSARVQVDVRLDEIVLRSLERDVDRRYQHASEVKADVENVSARPETAPPPRDLRKGLREFVLGLLVLPRDFSPAVRRWYLWRFVVITALWLILCVGLALLLPMRHSVTERLTLFPASRAYESLSFTGEDESYGALVLGTRAIRLEMLRLPVQFEVRSLPSHGQSAHVSALQVDLPGLQASQPVGESRYLRYFLLDREGLERWLREDLGLDTASPGLQSELTEIMGLLKRYESRSPETWRAFAEDTRNRLTQFQVQVSRYGWFMSSPMLRVFFYFLLPAYVLAMALLGRAARREQAPQIAAGTWRTPALTFYSMVLQQTFWGGVTFAAILGIAQWRMPSIWPGPATLARYVLIPTAFVFLLCTCLWLIRLWLQPKSC